MKKFFFIAVFYLLSLSFYSPKLISLKIEASPPTGIDLDVTHIEINPKYNRYRVEYYYDGLPKLYPIPGDPDNDPLTDKHWPDPGERIFLQAI